MGKGRLVGGPGLGGGWDQPLAGWILILLLSSPDTHRAAWLSASDFIGADLNSPIVVAGAITQGHKSPYSEMRCSHPIPNPVLDTGQVACCFRA